MNKKAKAIAFTAGAIAVLCIAALTAFFLTDAGETVEFLPDPVPLAAPPGVWTENQWQASSGISGSGSAVPSGLFGSRPGGMAETYPDTGETPDNSPTAGGGAAAYEMPPASDGEEYPKVVWESGNEVIIDFTDPNPEMAPRPDATGTDEKHFSQEDVPIQAASDDAPQDDTQDGAQSDPPEPAGSNNEGQVYDPVFGWVTPSKASSIPMDSDGDPDKMVGDMG